MSISKTEDPSLDGAPDAEPPADATKVGLENEARLVGWDDDDHLANLPLGLRAALSAGEQTELNDVLFEVATRGPFSIGTVREQCVRLRLRTVRAASFVGAWASHSSVSVAARGKAGITPLPRYLDSASELSDLKHDAISGVHVHVNVEDRNDRALVRGYLTEYEHVMIALTGSSPIKNGKNTLNASDRIHVFSNSASVIDSPPAQTFAEHKRFEAKAMEALGVDEPSRLHSFTRVVEAIPTVELRVFDSGLTIDDDIFTVLLADGLVSSIVDDIETGIGKRTCLSVDADDTLLMAVHREQAVKQGMSGQLRDMYSGEMAPAWEVAEQLFVRVRAGLRRVERLSGIEPESMVGLFDSLSAAIKIHGSGAQRMLNAVRKIMDGQVGAGMDVISFERWIDGSEPMADVTADCLQMWILQQNHFGELIPGAARENARLVALISMSDEPEHKKGEIAGLASMTAFRQELTAAKNEFDFEQEVSAAKMLFAPDVLDLGLSAPGQLAS